MSNSKKLTAKLMNEKLKRGWTTIDFANYLECSEEDFLKLLEKTFSKPGTRETLARLKKNEKLPKRIAKEIAICTETFDSSNEINVSEEECNDSNSNSNSENIVSGNNLSETLEALILKREDIQSSLNELELNHKALVSERSIIRNKIAEYRQTLIEIEAHVVACQTALANLVPELEEKYSLMLELDKSISEKREELSEINTKIENAQSITIYVYSSGDIEIDSAYSIEIPEADNDTVRKIISDEQAENLTLKQIKAVAKLITLVQNLEQQNLNYELVFDETAMEELFNKIKEE